MPIYEYRCDDCGELSEMLQRFDDPPLESCPECGGSVKKLISAPAFQFKGSGWYVTDYARSSADNGSQSTEGREGAGGAEAGAEGAGTESAATEPKQADKAAATAGGTTGTTGKGGRKESGTKGGDKSGDSAAASSG